MPNRDGGHYFLTALAPIHSDPCIGADGAVTSPTAAVRAALATLPTAVQSDADAASGRASPFARCHRTHLARLVVIDQPAFNGRNVADALADAVRKTDLLVHQPVDSFTRAWLLLAIDFDPGDGADGGLHDYLVGLWAVMADELRDIYAHCYDFTASVRDGDGFARYIARCQVETTMPFNDYWIDPRPLPTLPLGAMAAGTAALVLGGGLLGARAGIGWGVAAALVALGLAVWLAYRFVLARGGKPFPAAPDADLRTILKALYLQQRFARFAIAQQGADAPALHAAFGDFLAAARPETTDAPTQAPGVVRS